MQQTDNQSQSSRVADQQQLDGFIRGQYEEEALCTQYGRAKALHDTSMIRNVTEEMRRRGKPKHVNQEVCMSLARQAAQQVQVEESKH